MSDVNPMIIRKTQETLGKYVKKPALTEKLLTKPPFRFLHDVINVVIQETGYLNDVYSADELKYENIKDKAAKIMFLQKLIDAVKVSSTTTNLKAKPSKIVAGLEPAHTNELLQTIGKTVDTLKSQTNNNTNNNNVDKNASPTRAEENTTITQKKSTTTNKAEAINSNKNAVKVPKVKTVKATATRTTIKKTGAKPAAAAQKEEAANNKNKLKKKPSINTEDLQQQPQQQQQTEPQENQQQKPTEKLSRADAHQTQDLLEKTNGPSVEKNIFGEETELILNNDNNINNDKSLIETSSTKNHGSEVAVKDNVGEEERELDLKPSVSQVSNETVVIRNTSETSALTQPNTTTAGNSELIDVIDQEAELRRRERFSRAHRMPSTSNVHRQHSNEQSLLFSITDHDDNLDLEKPPVEPVEPPIKKSKRKSAKKTPSFDSGVSVGYGDEQQKTSSIQNPTTEQTSSSSVAGVRPPSHGRTTRTSLRPPSVRPASARPGAPRRRDRNVEIFLQPDETANMAGIQVKVDTFPTVDLDDDGDNLIVIKDDIMTPDAAVLPKESDSGVGLSDADSMLLGEQQGHLVQQILKTQKEFAKPDDGSSNAGDDMDKDFSMNRLRQSSAKQMDTLRESIQTLTRSVNPLGKLMDFLQEDVDSMEMELAAWRRTYNSTKVALKREISLNETAVQPLKQQLAQIEVTIREHIELTNTSRLNIMQNEEKIFKMLSED